jgi:hypothetical protein
MQVAVDYPTEREPGHSKEYYDPELHGREDVTPAKWKTATSEKQFDRMKG